MIFGVIEFLKLNFNENCFHIIIIINFFFHKQCFLIEMYDVALGKTCESYRRCCVTEN